LSSNNIETFYNPEFIGQGSIIDDLEKSELVLIGGKKNKNSEEVVSIYEKFMKKNPNFSILSYTSGEITKIAINSFLNKKITFANMIGEILIKSNKEDEISDVLETIASDKRIGNKYFNFGLGFGGPCLPRDNIALIKYAENLNLNLDLLSKVDENNIKNRKVISDFVICQNKENHPFFMERIGFKKGSDILNESIRLYFIRKFVKVEERK
jgi:Predicted UDP-glucose 6-dehydrogenase